MCASPIHYFHYQDIRTRLDRDRNGIACGLHTAGNIVFMHLFTIHPDNYTVIAAKFQGNGTGAGRNDAVADIG